MNNGLAKLGIRDKHYEVCEGTPGPLDGALPECEAFRMTPVIQR